MNIVHILANVGASSYGPGQVALHLAREQGFLGNDTCLWCLNEKSEGEKASSSSDLTMGSLRRFSASFPQALLLSGEMEKAAAREAGSISIVHQHALWTGLSRVTSLLREQCQVPSVISPHGALEKWALEKSWWKKKIALSLYEYRNLHGASCLQACSEQELAGFRDYGLKNPVAVIPNGISVSWLESEGDADRFRSRFSIAPGKRILLYLSRIAPVKGLSLLIEALAGLRRHLADWALVVAGGDELGHLRDIQELISRHNLGQHVTFTGFIDGQEKRDAFSAAALFVLPTKREAGPVAVLEALGASVPVITTKGAPWEDLVTYQCGWWTDVASDSIAEALDVAMSSAPDELQRMGQRGKELVAEKYNWTSSAQMTMDLYNWLLGRRERPDFIDIR